MSNWTVALAGLSLCCGCSTHHALRPDQLRTLDGYSPERRVESPREASGDSGAPRLHASLLAPGTLPLQDASGDWFTLDRNTVLTLKSESGDVASGTLITAGVEEDSLRAMLGDGAIVEVPLESIKSVDLANHSSGKTALLAVGIGAGAVAVAAIVLGSALLPRGPSSSGASGVTPCTLCWLPPGLLVEAAPASGRGPSH